MPGGLHPSDLSRRPFLRQLGIATGATLGASLFDDLRAVREILSAG